STLRTSALFLLVLFHAPRPAAYFTLSLHDALPISVDLHALLAVDEPASTCTGALVSRKQDGIACVGQRGLQVMENAAAFRHAARSEEHTSELQSRENLVCRLLLEKKKQLSANDHTL